MYIYITFPCLNFELCLKRESRLQIQLTLFHQIRPAEQAIAGYQGKFRHQHHRTRKGWTAEKNKPSNKFHLG